LPRVSGKKPHSKLEARSPKALFPRGFRQRRFSGPEALDGARQIRRLTYRGSLIEIVLQDGSRALNPLQRLETEESKLFALRALQEVGDSAYDLLVHGAVYLGEHFQRVPEILKVPHNLGLRGLPGCLTEDLEVMIYSPLLRKLLLQLSRQFLPMPVETERHHPCHRQQSLLALAVKEGTDFGFALATEDLFCFVRLLQRGKKLLILPSCRLGAPGRVVERIHRNTGHLSAGLFV
jgi:hypothetical protein